jgi:hypothetical protein
MTQQTQINFTTPANVATGVVTSYSVIVNGGPAYTFAAPATWAPGSAQSIPFASLTPSFVPVPGTAYTVGLEAVDAAGTSVESNVFSWTESVAVPNAPIITSVS